MAHNIYRKRITKYERLSFGVDISKLKNVSSVWMDDDHIKMYLVMQHLHNQRQIK